MHVLGIIVRILLKDVAAGQYRHVRRTESRVTPAFTESERGRVVVLALSKYLIRDTPLAWHCLLHSHQVSP